MKNKLKKHCSKPSVWAFTTYFAEGFPYTIIRSISSLFFRDMKVSLENIGLTSLFGLPWILKFLWAPVVDETSTKKRWMVAVQFILALMMINVAFLAPLTNGIPAIALILFLGSFVAATNDVVIDGYYMEALSQEDQAKYVGYRVMAYRIAMMAGTGVIATIGSVYNWFLAFFSAGILFLLIALFHRYFLPEVENRKKSVLKEFVSLFNVKTALFLVFASLAVYFIRVFLHSEFFTKLKLSYPFLKKIYFSHVVAVILLLFLVVLALFSKKIKATLEKNSESNYAKAFLTFIDRDKIGIILAFIILLRTGEWMLSSMVAPFMVDLGIKVHYGWLSAMVGLPASIIGAMVGGVLISKYSMRKMMWPFILAQNLTNVVYMVLALHLSKFIIMNTGVSNPQSIGAFNLFLVAFVQAFDQFAGGLGTAVLMTFLMKICIENYKAAHYAIGSGLMSVTGMFAGVLSGIIAGKLGYAWLFGISFLASVPAMALIPFLPKKYNSQEV